MAFLNVCFYLLASFALLDYLGKLFYERLSEWQEARQLVGGHPEMRGVDLERDDLIYFKADEAIRDVVLGNNEAGTNDPFLGDFFRCCARQLREPFVGKTHCFQVMEFLMADWKSVGQNIRFSIYNSFYLLYKPWIEP